MIPTRRGARRRAAHILFTAALAGTVALTACSNAGPAEPEASAPADATDVTFTLNYLPGAVGAGFSMAEKLGYYKDAGLNVTIEPGTGSINTATLVASGQSDLGYSDAPSVFGVINGGGDIDMVAPVFQRNVFVVISLKDKGITSVDDLVGKRVGVQPGTALATLLDAVLATNGVDADQITPVSLEPAALVGALLNGTVDAILGGADAQPPLLRSQGVDINELYYTEEGVPTIGFNIIANPEFAAANPEAVKAFVEASLKGWAAAADDVSAAAASVIDQFPESAAAPVIEDGLKSIIPLLCGPDADSLGVVADGDWDDTQKLLTEYNGLPADFSPADHISTDYLPADPPGCP